MNRHRGTGHPVKFYRVRRRGRAGFAAQPSAGSPPPAGRDEAEPTRVANGTAAVTPAAGRNGRRSCRSEGYRWSRNRRRATYRDLVRRRRRALASQCSLFCPEESGATLSLRVEKSMRSGSRRHFAPHFRITGKATYKGHKRELYCLGRRARPSALHSVEWVVCCHARKRRATLER